MLKTVVLRSVHKFIDNPTLRGGVYVLLTQSQPYLTIF